MTQSVHRHERLLSTVAEVRTILCFRVSESALRERLPPEWKAVPDTDGAHAGANLRLPLTDQQMVLDADGKPRPAARFADARPEFYRIYRVEHGEDIIMSKPLAINRTQSLAFKAIGPQLSRLFDGGAQLISIAALPWTRREVWLD
jgi:hypothetical protein